MYSSYYVEIPQKKIKNINTFIISQVTRKSNTQPVSLCKVISGSMRVDSAESEGKTCSGALRKGIMQKFTLVSKHGFNPSQQEI